MEDLYIIGCGGFGREVSDVVRAVNAVHHTWELRGFVDDDPSDRDVDRVRAIGLNVVGTTEDLLRLAPRHVVVGIGSGAVRRSIDARLVEHGWRMPVLVHPSATTGSANAMGEGTILCAGASLSTNIATGRHTHVNTNCAVGHDVTLGDFVTLFPLVSVGGYVTVDDLVTLGAHSAVLPSLHVGAGSFVGAAALVTKDVPSSVTVKGVPAR